jgi:hypothetical protein
VIRTIARRLIADLGDALPLGRAAPVAQANDICGIDDLRFRHRFGYDLAEIRHFEWLAQDREFKLGHAAGKAGDQYDRQAQLTLAERARQSDTVHRTGHHDIADDEIERRAFGKLQRLLGAARR